MKFASFLARAGARTWSGSVRGAIGALVLSAAGATLAQSAGPQEKESEQGSLVEPALVHSLEGRFDPYGCTTGAFENKAGDSALQGGLVDFEIVGQFHSNGYDFANDINGEIVWGPLLSRLLAGL